MSGCSSCQDASTYYDNLAGKLVSAKNLSEALDLFNKSLDQNLTNVNAWIHKGNAEKALQDYNASIGSFNRATILDSKNAAAWSALSDAYSQKKD
jgi:tetratricopeptide (TPR) repeat protein